jgi:hypothetical protein
MVEPKAPVAQWIEQRFPKARPKFDSCRGHFCHIRAVYAVAFPAGLRAGKLRALPWKDLDLAIDVIAVARSIDGSGTIVGRRAPIGDGINPAGRS